MKKLNYLFLLSILIVSISCSSNKFDYQSAYKFNTPNKSHSVKSTFELKAQTSETALSTDLIQDRLDTEIDSKDVSFEEKEEIAKSKVIELLSEMSKKEQKIVNRIEKKIERKLEAKPAASKSVNAKVYTGVVVGAAGLVLMILTSGTLGAIGGVALLVGLIFIVWGLLE